VGDVAWVGVFGGRVLGEWVVNKLRCKEYRRSTGVHLDTSEIWMEKRALAL
jgi:hypothetical protein